MADHVFIAIATPKFGRSKYRINRTALMTAMLMSPWEEIEATTKEEAEEWVKETFGHMEYDEITWIDDADTKCYFF